MNRARINPRVRRYRERHRRWPRSRRDTEGKDETKTLATKEQTP